jgi:uroporphyrinogen decarboxylase
VISRRDRVMAALSFAPTDRIPKDIGGMRSTGISGFAYAGLRSALGLPARLPRMYDTGQMLALPEKDVLDALDCDVVHVTMDECTNAFDEPERWTRYDFNGRLPALVQNPGAYRALADGTIVQDNGGGPARMVPGSFVFDTEHAGEILDLDAELREPDYAALERTLAARVVSPETARTVGAYCRRVRQSTDRAIFFNGLQVDLAFPGGMAAWSMTCLLHPDWVKEAHRLRAEHARAQVAALAPALKGCVDVVMLVADDQGTQNGPILPPSLFAELYVPFYRIMTDAVHAALPDAKVFLHCCGAVYDLLDSIVDCGFDVLNPVQWSAGSHGYEDWKKKCGKRLALWGGGVNTQKTLPLGSVADVRAEVSEVVPVMARGSGWVFASIHNILAEIDPAKVVAMYRTVGGGGCGEA